VVELGAGKYDSAKKSIFCENYQKPGWEKGFSLYNKTKQNTITIKTKQNETNVSIGCDRESSFPFSFPFFR
jgi:hypothetical protein